MVKAFKKWAEKKFACPSFLYRPAKRCFGVLLSKYLHMHSVYQKIENHFYKQTMESIEI